MLYDAYQFGRQNPVSRGALEIVARSVTLEDLRAQGQKFQAEVRTAARRDFREPFGDDFEKRVVARETQAVVQDGPREFEGFIDGMPVPSSSGEGGRSILAAPEDKVVVGEQFGMAAAKEGSQRSLETGRRFLSAGCGCRFHGRGLFQTAVAETGTLGLRQRCLGTCGTGRSGTGTDLPLRLLRLIVAGRLADELDVALGKDDVVGIGRAVASAHPRDIDQFVVLQFRTLRIVDEGAVHALADAQGRFRILEVKTPMVGVGTQNT